MSAGISASVSLRRLATAIWHARPATDPSDIWSAEQARRLQLLASIYASAGAGLCDDVGLMYAAAEALGRAIEGE